MERERREFVAVAGQADGAGAPDAGLGVVDECGAEAEGGGGHEGRVGEVEVVVDEVLEAGGGEAEAEVGVEGVGVGDYEEEELVGEVGGWFGGWEGLWGCEDLGFFFLGGGYLPGERWCPGGRFSL